MTGTDETPSDGEGSGIEDSTKTPPPNDTKLIKQEEGSLSQKLTVFWPTIKIRLRPLGSTGSYYAIGSRYPQKLTHRSQI